jgi:hypothetical protein
MAGVKTEESVPLALAPATDDVPCADDWLGSRAPVAPRTSRAADPVVRLKLLLADVEGAC